MRHSLVVVLGMHRSGTSAITKGLPVLGVELGDRLMPAVPNNNEKGFFEDVDITALDIELLHAGGFEWHTLVPIEISDIPAEFVELWEERARRVTEKKLAGRRAFGVKDPRMARLMPFWKRVWAPMTVDPVYIIVYRNPISVVESLFARDRLPSEKSHYLWLEHMVAAITETDGARRLVVDYDRLIDDPRNELLRISHFLGSDHSSDTELMAQFEGEFLDDRLRHHRHSLADLERDSSIPDIVRKAAGQFDAMAEDLIAPDAAEIGRAFVEYAQIIQFMKPAMKAILTLDNIINNQTGLAAARDVQIAQLTDSLAKNEASRNELAAQRGELTGRITQMDEEVSARNGQILELARNLAERESLLTELHQSVVRRDELLADLNKSIAERDLSIVSLHGMVEDRILQIASLNDELAVRKEMLVESRRIREENNLEIDRLGQVVADRDEELERVNAIAVERDARINDHIDALAASEVQNRSLTDTLAERNRRIAGLEQDLSDHIDALAASEGQNRSLTDTLVERNRRIAGLEQDLSDHITESDLQQLQIRQHAYRESATKATLAWKIAQPLRWAQAGLRKLTGDERVHFMPVSNLQGGGNEWIVTGQGAAFLLVGRRAWQGMPGWYALDFDLRTSEPFQVTLCLDLGTGFDSGVAIACGNFASGRQTIPLYVPSNCRMIRLDLIQPPARFRISGQHLRALKVPPSLGLPYAGQIRQYRRMGGLEATDDAKLVPAGGIQPLDDDQYRWQGVNSDPQFRVTGLEERLVPGWYLIDLAVRTDSGFDCAKLYFDYGEGYSEKHVVVMPYHSGKRIRRIYRIGDRPVALRFDPIEELGRFDVERFRISRLATPVALYYVWRRLSRQHGFYKNQLPWQAFAKLRNMALLKSETASALLNRHVNETFDHRKPAHAPSYAEWLEKHELAQPGPSFDETGKELVLARSPLFSVILPVYNTKAEHLRYAIDSVLAQSYPNWELCIADDASTQEDIQVLLRDYQTRDQRIKVVFRGKNGHISKATNSALEIAAGDYVAFLDHDDALAPDALLVVAHEISAKPEVKLIYSDEDKIDEIGRRFDPHFKPDWNPDLLLSHNYICHLSVFARERVNALGGLRIGYEGSQDYDLILRYTAGLAAAEIVHIPRVLYHWRAAEGSTALHAGEKSYTTDAGLRALSDHMAKVAPGTKVEAGLLPNTYHVCWPIPDPEPLVSLLIPTRDGLEVLEKCVRSILDHTSYQNYEIIILDNQSAKRETHDWFRKISRNPKVRVLLYDAEFNFSAINNYGAAHAKGEILGLINNDIEVIVPGWLTEMVTHASRPDIGCVGAKLYYDNDTIQHAGVILGIGGIAGHSHKYFLRTAPGYFSRLQIVQNLSAVTAACLVVKKAIYDEVGGLDEQNLTVAFNDVDFCLKVQARGYRNLWTPFAELYHHESVSRGAEDSAEKVIRFRSEIKYMEAKWNDILLHDPAYSPNLTLQHEDFSLRV